MGQVGDMFGIPKQSGGTIEKFVATLGDLSASNGPRSWCPSAVIVVILGSKAISPRIPGALIAVVGAIVVSWQMDLAADGVATLGVVPSGLPNFGFPSVTWSQFVSLHRHRRRHLHRRARPERGDLAGLRREVRGAASTRTSTSSASASRTPSAGLSGTFVVNGSPTKTQMVDGAGGKSQLASLTTAGHRAHRAALPHQAAAVHAHRRARVGRLPHRHRARRHQGPAHHLPDAPRRVRHRGHHRPARRRRRGRAGHRRRHRRLGHRPPAPQLRPQRLPCSSRPATATTARCRSPRADSSRPVSSSTGSPRASTTPTRTGSTRRSSAWSTARTRPPRCAASCSRPRRSSTSTTAAG